MVGNFVQTCCRTCLECFTRKSCSYIHNMYYFAFVAVLLHRALSLFIQYVLYIHTYVMYLCTLYICIILYVLSRIISPLSYVLVIWIRACTMYSTPSNFYPTKVILVHCMVHFTCRTIYSSHNPQDVTFNSPYH